jgi:predicted acetyltransferase
VGIDIRAITEADLERTNRIGREAFRAGTPRDVWLRSGRGLFEDGELRAIILVEPMGQFFGGRCVPTAIISFMAVALEHRGRGLGAWFIRQVLAECEAAGTTLAVHYPRVYSTYRRVGFEFAGAHYRYNAPVASTPPHSGTRAEPWGDDDLDEIAACYARFASGANGLVDRPREWWYERIMHSVAGEPVHRYCVRSNGQIGSYIVYTTTHVPGAEAQIYNVTARELIWNDHASAGSLLALIGQHAPLGQKLTWPGPINEPLSALVNADVHAEFSVHWMLRLIDVPAALERRGYPPTLTASVEFTVGDSVIAGNAGSFRLEVSDGQGRASRIAGAKTRIDIGTLAAIYSGWMTARDAARLGRLHDAGPHDIDALELIFSGPKPWLIERI